MSVESKKLNIAMFGHKHMLSREGGVEIVVYNLAIRMAEKGHKVVVYDRRTANVADGSAVDNRSEYKGVRIVPVWTIEKKGLAAMTSSFFAAIRAACSSADVIHIHAEGPAAVIPIIRVICKIRGHKAKVVVTIHGLDWQRAKWGGVASAYIKFGEKQAVKRADEIIVLSRGVQEYFNSIYGRKTAFIPNGITKPEIREAVEIERQWGLTKDSYVLFLGRIVPEKGLRYLIAAWKDIKTDKKLVIAGGSSDTADFMEELKQMSRGDDRIIFTGFQQGRVLEELYSNSYIYCLPSDLEGMPLSLLEAMSYGNCCLVSDISECAEVIENNGLMFSHSNVDSLRDALQELLNNSRKVDEYRAKSINYVTNKYRWSDVVDKTVNLYL